MEKFLWRDEGLFDSSELQKGISNFGDCHPERSEGPDIINCDGTEIPNEVRDLKPLSL